MEEITILKYLVAVTDKLLVIFIISGFVKSFLNLIDSKFIKSSFYVSYSLGVISAFSVFLMKVLNPKKTNIAIIKFNRYLIIVIAVVALVMLIFALLNTFYRTNKWIKYSLVVVSNLTIVATLLYYLPQVFQFTREFVYFGERTVSTMSLLRFGGFSMGVIVCIVVYFSVFYVAKNAKEKFSVFMTISYFIFFVYFALRAVTSMQRLKLVPRTDLVFQLMIFIDNNEILFPILQVLLVLIMAIVVIRMHIHVKGEYANKALKRKERARLRNVRRWSYSSMLSVVMGILILTAVHAYDTREVELAPPSDYQVDGNKILIPVEDISDGHLYRFSYITPNGYDVRFLAVKKPNGNSYGLGLDACEICGVAGYYERGDQVVCKRCDVVMNKSTIGFKGGCNPIPFPYDIQNKVIIIDKKDLEREEKRFK